MPWCLYYDDKTTFSDRDGEPRDAPSFGAVACVQPHLHDPYLTGADYLLWRTDKQEWVPCGAAGFEDQMLHFCHLIGTVKKGRWLPTAEWGKIWKRVRKDVEGK